MSGDYIGCAALAIRSTLPEVGVDESRGAAIRLDVVGQKSYGY